MRSLGYQYLNLPYVSTAGLRTAALKRKMRDLSDPGETIFLMEVDTGENIQLAFCPDNFLILARHKRPSQALSFSKNFLQRTTSPAVHFTSTMMIASTSAPRLPCRVLVGNAIVLVW